MSGQDAFGGCLGIAAAAIIGLAVYGPVGALLGALISAVFVSLFLVRGRSRAQRGDNRRQALQRQWDLDHKNESAPGLAGERHSRSASSTEAALQELEQLRSGGLITSDEYAKKRAEILERL